MSTEQAKSGQEGSRVNYLRVNVFSYRLCVNQKVGFITYLRVNAFNIIDSVLTKNLENKYNLRVNVFQSLVV